MWNRFFASTMPVFLSLFVAVSTVFANTPEFSQNKVSPWKQDYEKGETRVYTREVKGQIIREVKIETKLDSSMKAVLTVLADVEQFADWVPFLDRVEWAQVPNEQGVSYAYVRTALPWPIRNRDAYIRTEISYDPEKKQAVMKSVSEAGYKPQVEGVIRIPSSTAHWIMTDNGSGALDIEFMSHADPGGALPKWLINFAVITGPLQMLKNIRKTLDDEKWNANYPYDMDFVFGYPSPI